ncbi:ABC transporter ATP-binding protein [Xinfangfangia sp. CPCC 101601]|uniref:ABC transporter ATP-binding protein n=1 Tax=Pseudogemmobacter lacusdianii TaxID=3069608 RepID=A0ABU0W3G0_9RHOB|nr:ABC transporter ATP-binding protein [Xinfangfangia sp. CPCC 101601]MDQ2067620.1 ABC transporter ATP-binding protein [Xinfangfangia sp. CPCC 101601]
MTELLEVTDLRLSYGKLHALRGANLQARAGEVIGIVGESGCGKSTLASALIGLPAEGAALSGSIKIAGQEMVAASAASRRALRGDRVAMIFQDPMTAFNPVLTLGDQLIDFQHRSHLSRKEKRAKARDMLASVGLPDPDLALKRYMHELSGGMRQRASIAAALLVSPDLLIADEPTTALDVTMEAQIIHLFRQLRAHHHGAIVIVTHHLGVVGELCDRVYVMYAGEVVEEGTVDEIYHSPRHPYTAALIACDPMHLEVTDQRLPTIPGRLPDLTNPPRGCAFASRCVKAAAICAEPPPRKRLSPTQAALCHRIAE